MLTASEQGTGETGDSRIGHDPVRPDDAFWTDTRRAVFWDVVRRLAVAALLAFLAFAWAVVAILWLLDMALSGKLRPSDPVWLLWLLPGIGLFALSVVRLVEPRAPAMLRIIGVIYAILGAVFVLSMLEAV